MDNFTFFNKMTVALGHYNHISRKNSGGQKKSSRIDVIVNYWSARTLSRSEKMHVSPISTNEKSGFAIY